LLSRSLARKLRLDPPWRIRRSRHSDVDDEITGAGGNGTVDER
jgi:hypothetical protein